MALLLFIFLFGFLARIDCTLTEELTVSSGNPQAVSLTIPTKIKPSDRILLHFTSFGQHQKLSGSVNLLAAFNGRTVYESWKINTTVICFDQPDNKNSDQTEIKVAVFSELKTDTEVKITLTSGAGIGCEDGGQQSGCIDHVIAIVFLVVAGLVVVVVMVVMGYFCLYREGHKYEIVNKEKTKNGKYVKMDKEAAIIECDNKENVKTDHETTKDNENIDETTKHKESIENIKTSLCGKINKEFDQWNKLTKDFYMEKDIKSICQNVNITRKGRKKSGIKGLGEKLNYLNEEKETKENELIQIIKEEISKVEATQVFSIEDTEQLKSSLLAAVGQLT